MNVAAVMWFYSWGGWDRKHFRDAQTDICSGFQKFETTSGKNEFSDPCLESM